MNATGFRVLVAEDEQTFGLTVDPFPPEGGPRGEDLHHR